LENETIEKSISNKEYRIMNIEGKKKKCKNTTQVFQYFNL